MNRITQITKSNAFKVALFFLVDLALIGVSSILFIRSLKFWAVPFLRALYISISVIWAIATIWWVSVHFEFGKYWRGMIADLWSRQEDYERMLYKDYQRLMQQYPIAIGKHESQCRKRDPRPTAPEIMEEAIQTPKEVWEKLESDYQEKLDSKRTKK